MDMRDVWPDIYDEGHKNQFQNKPTHKAKASNDHKDYPQSTRENS